DFVGEEQVREDRTERGLEITGALVVDPRADEVGGHEVGGELDALELTADRLRDGLHGERLREAGHAFHEEMPAREKRDEDALEQMVLADDDLLDLEEEPARVGRHRGLLFFYDLPFSSSGG